MTDSSGYDYEKYVAEGEYTDVGGPDPEIALAQFAQALDDIAEGEWIDGTPNDLGRRLAIARWIEPRLDKIIKDLNDALALSMDSEQMRIMGWGELRRSAYSSTQWKDSDAPEELRREVKQAIVHSLAVDVGSGEINENTRRVANEAIDRMYQIIPSFTSVKAAGKNVYGIDIDEFRTSTRKWRVELYEDDR